MKLRTPSPDDLFIAANWLEVYEGAEDAEACKRVAVWLKEKSDDQEFKLSCKEAGVKVTYARQSLKRRGAQ